MLEEDTKFYKEFKRLFNNSDIPEADYSTPEVLEDTYMDMEIVIPRYGYGPQFSKETKHLGDENDILKVRCHETAMLYTKVQEVEYLDVHKSSIASNNIAENLFPQVDEEGNGFMLFYEIVDHSVDGTEITQKNALIVSNNRGERKRETTNGQGIPTQRKDGSMTWESIKEVK